MESGNKLMDAAKNSAYPKIGRHLKSRLAQGKRHNAAAASATQPARPAITAAGEAPPAESTRNISASGDKIKTPQMPSSRPWACADRPESFMARA